MSNRRGSISDYPEHLNPFYEGNEKLRFWKFGKVKRSGSFGETLRNTFTLKSFRGKKKNKPDTPSSPPELRKHGPTITPHQRQTLPTTLSPIYSPRISAGPPLPRSRFSERVGKSSPEEEVPNGHVPAAAPEISPTANPFEEEEKVAELKPKRIRRRKRRAPLPPNMAREEGDDAYLAVSSRHSFSKWSLTSVETDVSTYSESEQFGLDVVHQEMSEIMNNITKEMEKMTDDTDKQTKDEKHHPDIPDLIASSTEGIRKDDVDKLENVSAADVPEQENKEQPTDENSNFVSKLNRENVEELESTNNCDKNENSSSPEKELKQTDCDTREDAPSVDEELKNINNCDESESAPSKSECDSNRNSICEKSDPEVLYNATYTASVPDLNFNERKSIFITASNDELDKANSVENLDSTIEVKENIDINQNNNTSPPTSPRCKTEVNVFLGNCAQENSDEQKAENEEDKIEAVYRPIPKTRTNKLSKDDLLGNEITEKV